MGCYHCAKRIAVTAGHQTKSGHLYCTPCYQERAARRASREQRKEGEGAVGLIDDAAPRRSTHEPQAEPEQAVDEEAILSRWEPPAPWKMSLLLGLTGILLSVFFMVFPGYRAIPISAGSTIAYLPLGLVGLFLAGIGILWAMIGLMSLQYIEQRSRSIMGLVLAIVAGVMAVFVTKPPPMSSTQAELRGNAQERQFGSEAERAAWRQRFLGGDQRK